MSLVREPGPPPARQPGPVARRGRPPARNEVWRNGRLAGLAPALLAERFGTPAYIYDLDVVGRQVDALRRALPPRFDLAYAVKANPNLAILKHLAAMGLGADVASGGELRHVLRAGFDAEQVVMTGPGKRDEELVAAVDAGLRVITVESVGELRRLARIAEAAGRRQPILMRAAVTETARLERIRLVGDDGAGKFGMDIADLRIAAAEAVASPSLEPLGIHAFGASNVTDATALAGHVEAAVDTGRALAAAAGFDLRLVDAGGGLGIPYETHEAELDVVALGARLSGLSARLDADEATRGTRLLLEPGRYLVGPSGAYLTRVLERKQVGGHHVVIVDGGIHHVLRPALVGQEHRVRVLTGAGAGSNAGPNRFPVTVAGPLCSGLDVFAQAAVMALPDPGDLVAVLDVGAYGATESMPLFLSHPMPPEVAVRGGEAWAARPRIDPDTWLGWQTGEPGGA
ncbi:MAG: alanine racemase [Chloroflexota bacterium]